jgi:cell pole-organizing protein PopZ
MSASQTPPAGGNPADPSMEDILASIRRILSEDEVEHAAGTAAAAKPAAPADDGVLSLDASMIIDEPPRAAAPPPKPEPPPEMPVERPAAKLPVPAEPPTPAALPEALVAPEAAAAAASSVGALVRTLIAGREQVAVHRGGPTIEDLVREEIRPLLKEWLDANLPPLVERLVRAEIERVVGRAVS